MLMRTPAVRIATQPGPAAMSRSLPLVGTYIRIGSLDFLGSSITFNRNEEIYGENEVAEYFYKVVSGAVRTYRILSDGRRQIDAFHLPGDLFGLEARADHALSAEAVTDATVLVINRNTVIAHVHRDAEAARELWALTAHELQRVQDHLLLLVKNAQERVAAFLLEMAGRTPGKTTIELPMSRQDIADYLGLTIETVSRTLAQLEQSAAIALPTSRQVVLRNRSALNRLNS